MIKDLAFLDSRTRYVFILTYASEQEINEALKKQEHKIRAYAYITHDKDTDPNGELKQEHRHVLITLHNATTPNAVIKWFKKHTTQNVFAEPVEHGIASAYDYLTHANDPNKYQYSADDIKHGNLDYWLSIKDDKDDDNIALLIIDDLTRGTSYYDMTIRYGREWVVNHERYEMMYRKIRDGWRA